MYRIRDKRLGEQRRGQSTFMASFDPTILCTTYNYEMFPLGVTSLEDAVDRLPKNLTPDQRLSYLKKYSAIYHERRHFHDIVGTTYGVRLFFYGQSVLNQFVIKCLPLLQRLRTVRVPFIRWTELHDCPDEILSFVEMYNNANSDVAWFTTALDLPASYSSTSHVGVHTPGGSKPVPVIRFEDKKSQYYPLGGFALEEGAAFVVENLLIRKFFGREYEELYNQEVRILPGGKDYTAALSFFYGSTDSRNLDLFLSACDYGLNIGFPNDFRAGHPGWRFVLLCEQLGWKHTSDYSNAMGLASDRLKNNAGWPSLEESWREDAKYCQEQIEHNQDFYSQTQSLIGFVNLKYFSMAKTIFEKRLANTIHYDSFVSYVQSHGEFPSPPLRRQQVDGALVVLPSQYELQNAWLWLAWCFLWETVGNLVEGDGLVCRQFQDDAFSVDCFQHSYCEHTPGKSKCLYGRFIREIGLEAIQCQLVD